MSNNAELSRDIILVTRSIATQLYGVTPDDPLTVVVSVAGLLLSALAGSGNDVEHFPLVPV